MLVAVYGVEFATGDAGQELGQGCLAAAGLAD